jgi:ribosomal protein S18 acetylase RimI-like enzyme
MNNVTIDKATAADLPTLQAIGRETFFETFAESNTEADMAQYLERNFSAEKVRNELANPDSEFFIAWLEGTAIGYLKVNCGPAQTEMQDDTTLEIERIYVKREYHGRQAGQLLYEKSLEIAVDYGKKSIWLGVWEHNPRAVKFYEKNGFKAFGKHIFKMGNDEQTDIMMKKML